MSGRMGRISASTVLLFISGILLSDHCTNGQTTSNTMSAETTYQAPSTTIARPTTTIAGVVLTTSNCPSNVQAGRQICSSYVGLNDLGNLLASPNFDVCGTSLQQYACANLGNVAENTQYRILNCFLSNNNAIVTQGAYSLFFNQLSIDKVGSVMNMIKQKVPLSSITPQSRKYVLTAIWEKLIQDPQNLTPGSLASWMQDRLYAFLPAITTDILDCITSSSVTCDGLEAIVQGLNTQYLSFSNETKDDIGMWITKFIKAKSCKKDTLESSINSYYRDFKNNTNFKDFQMAFGNQNWSSAIGSFTEMQLEQYIESTNAFDSYKSSIPVLELLRNKDFAPTCGFLMNLPARNYNFDVLFSLLNILVDKLNSLKDPLCNPQLETIFQRKLNFLLVAINETILQKLAPKDCSGFQAIYQGIDIIYDQLSDDVKQSVFQSRMKFLDAEAAKSGSACTYGPNSTESNKWLMKNVGRSSERARYADLRRTNPNFDGYQAVSNLNMNQTIDMLMDTGIFTSTSPIDAQSRIASVTDSWKAKGLNYTKSAVKELKTGLAKSTIVRINIEIKYFMMESLWGVMEPQFDQFQARDWQSLTEDMSYFLPSIGTKQLSAMSINVVKSCTNLRTIVGGIGAVYDDMNDNSKSEVTDWISNFLRNESSHCTSGVGDWLIDNYKEFKPNVRVATIMNINPNYNLRDSIDKLASKQLGQFVMQDSEAHTNVTVVEKVFKVLTNGTSEKTVENLENFWDGFNAEPEKADIVSYEVKNYMLSETVSQLSTNLGNFASETNIWFQKRLTPVISTLDAKVLNKIPINASCGSQKSFVQAVSSVYNDTRDANKADILNHIQKYMRNDQQNRPEAERCTTKETSTVSYIQNYWKAFSGKVTYEELYSYYENFDAFESGVFQKLNSDQLGDMIVQENVYKSEEKVNQVFTYLQTQRPETVDAVMTRFSKTGNMKNIKIDNTSIGQQMLRSYFDTVKSKRVTINIVRLDELLESILPMLNEFFTSKTLSTFDVQDCDTLSVITGKLNKDFSKMTDSTRTDISNWITSNLKSPPLNGCTKVYSNPVQWVNSTMGDFFKYSTLQQAQEINPQLNVLQIISQTSIPQKVEYLMSSNALTDVSKTMTVLDSLKIHDSTNTRQQLIFFMFDFNTEYDKIIGKTMTPEVRQAAMTFMLKNYVSGLNSSMGEQTSNFREAFRYFIGGITPEAVQQIPDTINCDTYKNILSGISSGFDQFSENVTSSVFKWIIRFMDYNYNSASGACSNLYTDSRSYIQVMFQRFSVKATVYQLQYYYTKFNAYSCLDLLTGKHLGNLLANTTAITNQLDAGQILFEMKKRDTEDVKSFFSEVNQVAQEKKITQLPDSNVRNMIFTALKPKLFESLETNQPMDYRFWFGADIIIVLPSFTSKDITSLRMNMDCSSQSYMVGGFSKVYSQLDDSQKTAMYNRIKTFNQDILASTGRACPTPTGTSREWVQTSWGNFSRQATLADFQAGNPKFNTVSSLNACTGSQVADYAMQSGALNSESAITPVLDSIDSPEKAKTFLDQVNSRASEELQNSPVADRILNKTFKVLSSVMNTFQPTEWQVWFQDTLAPILHNIDGTELEMINYPMNCASYQKVLTGLNNVFDRMSANSRQAVYDKFIRPQFDSVKAISGIKCGQKKEKPEVWVQNNFGSFATYPKISQFIDSNVEFSPIRAIRSLGPNQLSDVAVSEAKNEDVAWQVAARVRQFDVSDVNTFLDTMSATLKEKNMSSGSVSNAVGVQLLSSCLSVINNSLSSYSSSDWKALVSNRLQPLFFCIDSNQLSTLLRSADCSAYKMILQQLDNNYNNLTPDNRLSLFAVLNGYISSKTTDKGFCPESGENSSTAIMRSIGRFSFYMKYSKFKEIYPDFIWSTVNNLSPGHLASVTLTENVFTDQVQANALNDRLMKMSFQDTDTYLRALQPTAQAGKSLPMPYGAIAQTIAISIFSRVSPQFTSFDNSQWNDYFGSSSALMSRFLPSLSENQVQQIPETIDCMSFQSFVSGFSVVYNELQEGVQAALYAKTKSYLTKQKELNGSACPTSGNSGKWLVRNMGAMRVAATMADIFAINPGFNVMDAVPDLTPKQLGSFAANKTVLSDQDKMNTILSAMSSKTIGPFMDAFNAAAKMNGITAINNAAVKKRFLEEIFCKIESTFTSFDVKGYSYFFENTLQMFLSSLNARFLMSIPTDIGCDSLAAIMQPLIGVKNPENPTDVFNFVNSVLTAEKANTGSACTGNLDTKLWGQKYIGQYLKSGSWSAIKALNPNFDVASGADLLSATQRAAASAESNVINNVIAISAVVDTFKGDITSLSSYMKTLRQSILTDPTLLSNSKVKEVLLGAAAKNMFTQFNTLSASEIQNSMTAISFLLPSINATILEDIPYTIGCPQFQAFASAMNSVVSSLTESKKKDVANFIQRFMSYKVRNGDDPCTIGTSNTVQWVTQNIGKFCPFLLADNLAGIYPNLDKASYTALCNLS